MLARASSDASTRIRRSKSASTVHKHTSSITEPLDLDAVKQQAIAAATAAFARAQAQEAIERKTKRGSDVSRSKSNASRKSLGSEGSHFPPRGSSFRSSRPHKNEQTTSTHRQSRTLTTTIQQNTEQNTEQFPLFRPTSSIDRPLSAPRALTTQSSVTFGDDARPGSQAKSMRPSAASSATSQQMRKARSMYYASSVQTGSPIARPPAKYLNTLSSASASPAQESPNVYLHTRTLAPSPLAGPRMSVNIATDATVDQARDQVLQNFQQKTVKHKPSVFLAPFKKRQDKGKEKDKRIPSDVQSISTNSQQAPDESTTDHNLTDFAPRPEMKEKRSFSGSLKSKFKRVFRRTSAKSTTTALPVQQIEASREYFHTSHLSPTNADDAYTIPPPNENTLQRIRARTPSLENARPAYIRSGSRSGSNGSARSNRSLHSEGNANYVSGSRVTSWGTSSTGDTMTQRAIKRMTVIHESKDSIGSEADRVASAGLGRKPVTVLPLASFRDPMPMESLTEESWTPVDPKRVFSALMREIGNSQSVQASSSPMNRTPGAESDVFESSTTKLHCYTRELHSSGSRNLRTSNELSERPPSRRPPSAAAQSAQSKTSTIRSLGRAIRSTIRTVTPAEHHVSSDPEDSVCITTRDKEVQSAGTTPRSDDSYHDDKLGGSHHTTQMFTPSASLIEKRVEKAKDRWKTPLEEAEHLQFPRETDRMYDVTAFSQGTASYDVPRRSVEDREQLRHIIETDDKHSDKPPTSPNVSVSPSPRPTILPMSPSVYSRGTDGVSILPNNSIMSFGGSSELERSHDGGSAVILTSQSVRSYVIGTPSPSRPNRPDSSRASRDWKAWLSHEVSGMESPSQDDLRIHEQYATPSGRYRSNSTRTSHTENEDTTVVLREPYDYTTTQPDHKPPANDNVTYVAGRSSAQQQSEHQGHDELELAMLVLEKSTSHVNTSGKNPPSSSSTTQVVKNVHLQRSSPRLGPIPVSSRQQALSISINHATGQPMPETPKSPPMNEQFPFMDSGKRSSSTGAASFVHSKSPTDGTASLESTKSPKLVPGSKVQSDTPVPAINETPHRVQNTNLRRSDAQNNRKENVTPPSIQRSSKYDVSPLGLSPRPRSQQPLSSSALTRNTSNVSPYVAKVPVSESVEHKSSPVATPSRPRIRATLRSISPEKPARRPRSAIDLRGTNGVGRPNLSVINAPSSDLRRPALHLKTSTSSFAMSKEPSPDAMDRPIDSILNAEHGGSITPGQRMADRFLRERKSTPAPDSGERRRGGLRLVREDTPAFL